MAKLSPLAAGTPITTGWPQQSQRPGHNEGDDDESEWEYEYSTTETETYYLPVDLSTSDLAYRKDEHIVHNTRAGYRTWFNPMTEKPANGLGADDDADGGEHDDSQPPASVFKDGRRRRDAGDEDRDDNEDDEDDEDGDAVAGGGVGHRRGEATPLEIQILELHSERPLIAHKGLVFTGSWMRNIGTELIFTGPLEEGDGRVGQYPGEAGVAEAMWTDDDACSTPPSPSPSQQLRNDEARHRVDGSNNNTDDEDNNNSSMNPDAAHSPPLDRGSKLPRPPPTTTAQQQQQQQQQQRLPHLAALPGATLLAASSVRLQCTPTTLTRRSLPRQRHRAWAEARASNRCAIHVVDDYLGVRRPQARFLERLMALKRRKGEHDGVTVATVENAENVSDDDDDDDDGAGGGEDYGVGAGGGAGAGEEDEDEGEDEEEDDGLGKRGKRLRFDSGVRRRRRKGDARDGTGRDGSRVAKRARIDSRKGNEVMTRTAS